MSIQSLSPRLAAFHALRNRLLVYPDELKAELFFNAQSANGWFTPTQCETAWKGILSLLEPVALEAWANKYATHSISSSKHVGVIMAGNIPMVGFHDVLCVLLSRHQLMVKLSSTDAVLMKFLLTNLKEISPELEAEIQQVEQIKSPDAIIATGSDNSARYFEFYFSKYPYIIRKNRTSVAVLNGKETNFEGLGTDIFTYFGLGCRNVSKLYVPEGYVFKDLFDQLASFEEIIHHHKYRNNYDYNKSIYLVNRVDHYDTGFLMVTQSERLVSPISVLYYETYQDENDLKQKLIRDKEKIQVIVSDKSWYPGSVSFGEAQFPGIAEYADGVDTMKFLMNLHG
jgi:hypothetical protein